VGDSPVREINKSLLLTHPSIAGHVKPCENLSRPLDKAKYDLVTDSELVP